MSTSAAALLGLWATYWSALFAEVAHLRMQDDGFGAAGFAWISLALLATGLGLLLAGAA